MRVDFTPWATPTLDLTLDGTTYVLRPPTVEHARVLDALSNTFMDRIGYTTAPLSDEQKTMAAQPLEPAGLGVDLVEQMTTAGIPAATIGRVALYAVLFWTRGKAQADTLATAMWGPTTTEAGTTTTTKED